MASAPTDGNGDPGRAGAGGSGGAGVAVHLVTGGAAATRAVAIVEDRLAAGARPADVVALARVNAALLPLQVALTDAGIGHSAPLDASVLGRTGLRTALAYLRLALAPQRMRREDLLDTLNRPTRKVKSAVAPHLARSRHWTMAQLERVADGLDPTQQERFTGYLGDLHHLAHAIAEGADTARCLWTIRTRIGLGEAMDALDASRTRPEGSSHGDDLDALAQLADDHPDPATFRERLVERLRVPADPHGMTLSTVHRVKGLEWDHVLVVAANDGLFPHRLSEDVEEERRVFHVALTRCRERVDVVADRDRPSPFLAQLRREPTAPRRRTDPASRLPDTVRPTRLAGDAIAAVPGLEVTVAGGLTGRVTAVDGEVAVVAAPTPVGPLTLRVPFGQPVRVAGAAATLTHRPRTTVTGGPRPLADVPPEGAADPALFEQLRAWRARTAAAANQPAFLVFHDRTLQAIAARKPRSVRELGAVPGVGPAKLERYADDLLELLDAHG